MPGIPISSAPAAKHWLFTTLQDSLTADPGNGLVVCLDSPGTNVPNDGVAVGRVNRSLDISSLVGGAGAGFLNETYTIDVTIEVFRGGDNAELATNRAFALIDGVVHAVRTDPTMGGSVLWAKPTTSNCDCDWADDHKGRLASATVQISCFQRI